MGARKTIRVTIDTNVVVSGLLFGGQPGRIVELWKSGELNPFASRSIIEEYIRVLTYPKFQLIEEDIDYLVYKEILPYFEIVHVKDTPPIGELDDPSDDIFLKCATKANAKAVISGDHHLLKLKYYQKIPILTVTQFLKQMKLQLSG